MYRRRVVLTVVALASGLAGCGGAAPPDTGSQPANAVAIASAKQLAEVVGCTGYKPSAPSGFKEGGDCTIGDVDFHLYVFASNSDRNALVNGIVKTSGDVKYAIGDRYTIASLDEATIKTAAGKLGATLQ